MTSERPMTPLEMLAYMVEQKAPAAAIANQRRLCGLPAEDRPAPRSLSPETTITQPSSKKLELLTVYTAGYGGRSIDELITAGKTLRERGEAPLLVDIRFKPWSKQPGWSQRELRSRLKARYRHVPDLGNVNAGVKDAGIEIFALERGLAFVLQLLEAGESPILLCGCRPPANCHRTLVANALQQRGIVTQELWTD